MQTLFVVNPESADRNLFEAQFGQEFKLSFFGDAKSCAKAVRRMQKEHGEDPDAIIIDLRLPQGSGLDLFHNLSPSLEDTQFILLVDHQDDHLLPEIIQAGVVNYVIKKQNYMRLLNSAVPRKMSLARL